MATLSAARATRERLGLDFSYGAAANAVVYAGSMVTLTAAGYVRNGVAGGTRCVGVAQANVNNTGGADGAKNVPVKKGTFQFLNLPADLVTPADIGNDCYLVDDETVARTSNAGARVIAGKVAAIEMMGATSTVWVTF
jgi:hypothetical protein